VKFLPYPRGGRGGSPRRPTPGCSPTSPPRDLDGDFLSEIRSHDEAALSHVARNDPAAFRDHLSTQGNPTRVCSAGCVFTLLRALPAARPTLLGYHQAVTAAMHNCVTCAAVVLHHA
jgi:hypothetical protein